MRFALLVCTSSAALAAPAAAQTAGPANDAIIVTAPNYVPEGSEAATKSDIPLIETPQSVTVITRDQIDLLDWSNLGQTVRYVAGVTGENYGPDERVDWLTMRGFEPVQFVDGLQASIGSIANTGLDLYGAESVEILKGPSSVLYGIAPPGGIVNITSRRPQNDFAGEIEGQIGNRDHRQINGDITGALADGVSARLTALYRDRGTQTREVDSERLYVAPALTLRPGPDSRITLLSYYQRDEVTGDGGGFLPAQGTLLPNPNGRISSTANLGEPGYNRFLRRHWGIGYDASHDLSDTISIHQNLKFTHLYSDQRGVGGNGFVDSDSNGTPDDYRNVARYSFSFRENVDTFAVDTRINAGLRTGAVQHDLVAGIDYRNYDYLGSSAFGFGIPPIDAYAPDYGALIPALPPLPFSSQEQRQIGLYAQDQLRLGGGLILTLAGRHDWIRDCEKLADTRRSFGDFSYRAGLSYVFDNGIAPYLSFARSFEPVAGADRSGTPFDPTTGRQIEAGLKFDARNAPDGTKLFATLAAYHLVQQNVLTPDTANAGGESFQVQTGEVTVEGIEAELVARFNERLSLNASYTYTDSEVTESNGPELGDQLPVTPHHKLSALADYTFQDGSLAGLGASFGGRYLSKSTGNLTSAFAPTVFVNPAVTLFDASIHYDRSDWRFAVTASNLFDKDYVARCYSNTNCFFGTRRVVTASVRRRF
ncbi:TonB-dependent siderophore receptor [Allosphingosinicella deserti]|uniref:TonB-dependent siderophore receptor n=1 Tax=Allosphingosinicella deserti TaxID=2116704 RepID=UPI001304A228|nr:TonB-dependent siderophore receptor [Sphingomonas deserti]